MAIQLNEASEIGPDDTLMNGHEMKKSKTGKRYSLNDLVRRRLPPPPRRASNEVADLARADAQQLGVPPTSPNHHLVVDASAALLKAVDSRSIAGRMRALYEYCDVIAAIEPLDFQKLVNQHLLKKIDRIILKPLIAISAMHLQSPLAEQTTLSYQDGDGWYMWHLYVHSHHHSLLRVGTQPLMRSQEPSEWIPTTTYGYEYRVRMRSQCDYTDCISDLSFSFERRTMMAEHDEKGEYDKVKQLIRDTIEEAIGCVWGRVHLEIDICRYMGPLLYD